jgi:DNA-binding NarL/FixJ family response regulator
MTSLELLLFLARHLETSRICILGTSRDIDAGGPHPLQEVHGELIRDRLVETFRIHRLDQFGTAALVRGCLGTEAVPDRLLQLIHQQAEGNPFFTEELVAAMIDNGTLVRTRHGIEVRTVSDIEVPRSIRSIVVERVARLPIRSQQILGLASLLGQEFGLDALIAASEHSETEVLDALDAALASDLIHERTGDGVSFAFTHALIQQALYQHMPSYRRRRMHMRVGDRLARSTQLTPADADLARHFLLGGDPARAANYSITAADNAATRYAHAEAVHHYQTAVRLLTELGETARAAHAGYRLGSELYDLNRLADAVDAYEGALARFEFIGDSRGEALTHWGIARLHQGRYDMAAAKQHVDSALRLWSPEPEDREFVRLLVDAARAHTFAGDSQTGIELAQRGLKLAEQIDDPSLLAAALFGMSIVQSAADPVLRTIVSLLDRAVQLAIDVGDSRVLSRLYLNRATNRWLRGDLEGGISDRRRAVLAAQRSGEIERLALALETLGMQLMQVGKWEEGKASAQEGIGLDSEQAFMGTMGPVYLTWMDGRHDEALRISQTFIAGARQRMDFQGIGLSLVWDANLKLQVGRVEDAETSAREALVIVRDRWRSALGLASAVAAETAARLDRKDTETLLAEAEHCVAAFGMDLALPQVFRAKGIWWVRQNALHAAIECLQSSAAAARSQHSLVELAQTLTFLSAVGRRLGDEALARRADEERLMIVERVGTSARNLVWTQGLVQTGSLHRARKSTGPLTPREREIVSLIVAGHSNRLIADSLIISERTVENHVSSILARLGLETRAQVAVWAVQNGLGEPNA